MAQGSSEASARVWIRRVRAGQWLHFLPLPAAGVAWSRGWTHALPSLLRGVVAAAAVLAFGYLLNAVADREMDLDPEKNPLTREAPAPHRGALAAIALAALVSSAVSPWALLAASVSLVSGWGYSAGPRLKARPFVGTALNVSSFGPLLFVAAEGAREAAAVLPLALAFAGLLVQNQLLHESADLEEDRLGGLRTTFSVLGAGGSAAVALACALAALCGLFAATRGAPGVGLGALVLACSLLAPVALLRRWPPSRARRAHRGAAAVAGAAVFFAARA